MHVEPLAMSENAKTQAPRGHVGFKRRISNLVKESALRGLVKSSKKGRTSAEPLTLQDIHTKMELPKDLTNFNLDYSDTENFRHSFMGSDFDGDTLNFDKNRFSFVSSTFEADIGKKHEGVGTYMHQVIPDIDTDFDGKAISPYLQPIS